jgi:hypothetical protein
MPIKLPKKLIFTEWKLWAKRESTTDPEGDVPSEFDFAGLYIFACFPEGPETASKPDSRNLIEEVVYIGQSMRITKRLEGKRHEKIETYRTQYRDPDLEYLYFAFWEFKTSIDWNIDPDKDIVNAAIQYFERKCIFDYINKFGQLPGLNNT